MSAIIFGYIPVQLYCYSDDALVVTRFAQARSMVDSGKMTVAEYRKMTELNFRLVESQTEDVDAKHSFIVYGKVCWNSVHVCLCVCVC